MINLLKAYRGLSPGRYRVELVHNNDGVPASYLLSTGCERLWVPADLCRPE